MDTTDCYGMCTYDVYHVMLHSGAWDLHVPACRQLVLSTCVTLNPP